MKSASASFVLTQKAVVLGALSKIRVEIDQATKARRLPIEVPFDVKRSVLELLVDVIWVNSEDRMFTVEGVIKGTFALDDAERLVLELPVEAGEPGDFAFISTPSTS